MSTNQAWDMKYKPKKPEELLYPTKQIEEFVTNIFETNTIPGNILFQGKAGSGKTSTVDVIINQFVKGPYDVFTFEDYKKESIDKFEQWLRNSGNSIKRIAKAEEFERKQHIMPDASIIRLKNGLLEKYQKKVSVLATSNDISGFEDAIIRRFTVLNYIVKLDDYNTPQIIKRMEYILKNENVEYEETDIQNHISQYEWFTPAQIIKDMQLKVNKTSGKFDGNISVISNILDEDTLLIHDIYKKLLEKMENSTKRDLVLMWKGKTSLFPEIRKIQEIITGNKSVNYHLIFKELIENTELPLPVKLSLIKYHEDLDTKIYKDQHFVASIFQLIKVYSQLNENVKKD